MTDLIHRKTRLVLVTPFAVRGRAVIAEVKAEGMEIREKGKRHRMFVSWAGVYWAAVKASAAKSQAERQQSRKGR
jgi:hypothetical protein